MPDAAIVRLLAPDNTVVGYGFNSSSGSIFASSRGVREALGGAKFTHLASATSKVITVDFPFSSQTDPFEAEITRWDPPRDSGPRDRITTLRLKGHAPAAIFMDPTRQVGGEISVSLNLFSHGDLRSIEGTVTAREDEIVWALSLKDVREASNPRLAGTTVWDAQGQLIGLVLGHMAGSRRRYVASISSILRREVLADATAGSDKWHLDNAMCRAPLRLVEDLTSLEAAGLDPEDCEQVKAALKRLVKELESFETNLPYGQPPSERAKTLYSVYDRWNGGKKGEAGRTHRRTFLAGVDDGAHALSRSRAHLPESLYNRQVREGAESVMDLFAQLPSIHTHTGETAFPQIRKLVSRYRQRK